MYVKNKYEITCDVFSIVFYIPGDK